MAQDYILQLRITGPEISDVFLIPPGKSIIGRQSGTDIHLNHSMVSRQHASIECTDDGCFLTDLESANGTTVNGARLPGNVPTQLVHEDNIEIGPFKLVFERVPVAMPDVEAPPPRSDEPPPPPPPPAFLRRPRPEPQYHLPPPGLSKADSHYLNFLPSIYHNKFMGQFLAIFEAILGPIEWNVANFDLYLDPGTAPVEFLPWLATWFDIGFDSTWSEEQRRTLLREAHELYARRGTRWALSRILEIYTGHKPEIDDTDEKLEDFTFRVTLPVAEKEVARDLVERIIDGNKPAHTIYELEFAQNGAKKSRRRKK